MYTEERLPAPTIPHGSGHTHAATDRVDLKGLTRVQTVCISRAHTHRELLRGWLLEPCRGGFPFIRLFRE